MNTFVRGVVLFSGLVFVLTGLALLLAPAWFFNTIGNFPPFNRHYLGDTGAFVLALGLGLLWAARDPYQYRGIIAVTAIGSWLHVGNHLYDDFVAGAWSPAHFLGDTLPLLVLAVALLLIWLRLARVAVE